MLDNEDLAVPVIVTNQLIARENYGRGHKSLNELDFTLNCSQCSEWLPRMLPTTEGRQPRFLSHLVMAVIGVLGVAGY